MSTYRKAIERWFIDLLSDKFTMVTPYKVARQAV